MPEPRLLHSVASARKYERWLNEAIDRLILTSDA